MLSIVLGWPLSTLVKVSGPMPVTVPHCRPIATRGFLVEANGMPHRATQADSTPKAGGLLGALMNDDSVPWYGLGDLPADMVGFHMSLRVEQRPIDFWWQMLLTSQPTGSGLSNSLAPYLQLVWTTGKEIQIHDQNYLVAYVSSFPAGVFQSHGVFDTIGTVPSVKWVRTFYNKDSIQEMVLDPHLTVKSLQKVVAGMTSVQSAEGSSQNMKRVVGAILAKVGQGMNFKDAETEFGLGEPIAVNAGRPRYSYAYVETKPIEAIDTSVQFNHALDGLHIKQLTNRRETIVAFSQPNDSKNQIVAGYADGHVARITHALFVAQMKKFKGRRTRSLGGKGRA